MKSYIVKGYKVDVFNYFLCGYNMFANPISDRPEVNAFDMRGATFVFNEDGTLYKKFLMLPKFFNINEVETTQYHVIKDKKIKSITVKEDGSLISFMQLPNGEVFIKTLGGLDNDQVKTSMKIYNSDINLQIMVRNILSADYTPLFEYVSFDNKIVLNYSESQLRLIGIRDNISHDYVPYCGLDSTFKGFIKKNNIVGVDSIDGKSLDDIVEVCNSNTEIEGFVIEFEDGQLVKCKTKWYFSVHKLHTESINREDYVIESYLKDTLDDILARFDRTKDSNVFTFVNEVKSAVDNYMKELLMNSNNLYSIYVNDYDRNLRDFAKKEHKNEYFKFAKCIIDDGGKYIKCKIAIKDHILKKTFRLQNARDLVEKYKDK